MRFIPKGPLIPSELLIARDQGRVVFFCGAGVSYAKANLPNFYNLALNVCKTLGVPNTHPAMKLITHVHKFERKIDTTGIVSMDRVFGLLERDFDSRDIEKSVATSLKPVQGVDLSVHNILLRLATTTDNKIQLITTNFDRLFNECLQSLHPWVAPKLPTLSIHKELNGIIYLHGRVTENYDGSESGFVLSSSGFGRAYLSDGWATEFFKNILSKYIVLFIGYSADDPPINYLLEALNITSPSISKQIYAFQSNDKKSHIDKWKQKGVTPIPYNSKNGHIYLWDTLEKWSERAKDIEGWYEQVISKAQKRPSQISSYVRGQVAHIISNTEGARKFATHDPCPPAEWLFVFDASCRYGISDRKKDNKSELARRHSLDSDKYMPKINSIFDRITWLKMNAWDGLKVNEFDWRDVTEDHVSQVAGHHSITQPKLLPRLQALAEWLVRVSDQPAAIWWASMNKGLHPTILQKIQWELQKKTDIKSKILRRLWEYFSYICKNCNRDIIIEYNDLKLNIENDGWDIFYINRFVDIYKPNINIKYEYIKDINNCNFKKLKNQNILPLYVDYPCLPSEDIKIPDNLLIYFCESIRKNIEYAINIEKEFKYYELKILSPIIQDETINDNSDKRKNGLSGIMIFYANFFEKLVLYNSDLAKNEYNKWDVSDNIVFARLRIWASGFDLLFSNKEAGEIILGLNDAIFWRYQHQRDLLLTLAKRWGTLPLNLRKSLERRLLKKRQKWYEDEENFVQNSAYERLNRLTWLSNHGCQFSFNLKKIINSLQIIAPRWKPECAYMAVESTDPRSEIVNIENNYEELLVVPYNKILSKADEINKNRDNFLELIS